MRLRLAFTLKPLALANSRSFDSVHGLASESTHSAQDDRVVGIVQRSFVGISRCAKAPLPPDDRRKHGNASLPLCTHRLIPSRS
jgi:hypothetical protein